MKPNFADIIAQVQQALAEDIGSGDVTAALLSATQRTTARIYSREPMLVCGQDWVNCAFQLLDPTVTINWLVEEGAWLAQPMLLSEITGLTHTLLTAERTALNFLQTLSGTATTTYYFLQKLSKYTTQLLDTRKTIPGLRQAQKYAVACAGGLNHRYGLYDAFLIKENHIQACGSIARAINSARAMHKNLLIVIEVTTLVELQAAFAAKPDRIILDNFNEAMIKTAITMNHPKNCALEVSGNVNLSNLTTIAQTGVDYVSVGMLTKSLVAVDLSLLIG